MRPKQTIGKRILKHRANKLQKARIRALKAMNQIIENAKGRLDLYSPHETIIYWKNYGV